MKFLVLQSLRTVARTVDILEVFTLKNTAYVAFVIKLYI